MKIYTKTGDYGETSLYGERRVPKSALAIEAYGSVDELNSFIGLALIEITQLDVKNFLKTVQTDLLTIGSDLSGYPKEELNLELRVVEIEKVIDEFANKLPKLHNFILPGGGKLGATLHVARAVARRTERIVIRFLTSSEAGNINKERKQKIIKYLNRVSDFLYMLARFANKEEGIEEEIWKAKIS